MCSKSKSAYFVSVQFCVSRDRFDSKPHICQLDSTHSKDEPLFSTYIQVNVFLTVRKKCYFVVINNEIVGFETVRASDHFFQLMRYSIFLSANFCLFLKTYSLIFYDNFRCCFKSGVIPRSGG